MTEPLHHITMILFGIITEGGNVLLKAGGWTLRIKAGFLPTLIRNHLLAVLPAGLALNSRNTCKFMLPLRKHGNCAKITLFLHEYSI